MSQATDPALCPDDGSTADRVFTMPLTYVKGAASGSDGDAGGLPSSGAGDFDAGHGHSHGPGGHTH